MENQDEFDLVVDGTYCVEGDSIIVLDVVIELDFERRGSRVCVGTQYLFMKENR